MSVAVILCTVPTRDVADTITRALLEKKLAACVNIAGPVTSVYEWEGSIQEDTEYQLFIKTTQACADDTYQCVKQHHPYDVPEWLVIDNISGSKPYIDWLTTTVSDK